MLNVSTAISGRRFRTLRIEMTSAFCGFYETFGTAVPMYKQDSLNPDKFDLCGE